MMNKIVLITGATGTVGRATALEIAKSGATVVLLSLNSFGASKMMNLMFTYSLAKRLEGTGVTAVALHPGLVKSDLTKEMPSLLKYITRLMAGKPDKAAKMLCSLAIDSKFESSNGKFYKFDGKEIKSNKYSYDKELQKKLWTISKQLSH